MDNEARANIGDILGVRNSLNTTRYLGLPSLIGRDKKSMFAYTCVILWQQLHSWRGKKLSKAGKEVLIKVVAQVIPMYLMSIFLLPSTFLNELHCMINKFWWKMTQIIRNGLFVRKSGILM